MKRRILAVSLALLVILSLSLSMAAPAMAGEPCDDEPVSSVSWSGRIAIPDGQYDSDALFSISVKKYADGTVVGHIREKHLDSGDDYRLPVLDAHFHSGANGAKTTDLLTAVTDTTVSPPITFYFWAQLSDRGEPGVGTDTFARYVYTAHVVPIWPYTAVKIGIVPGTNPPQYYFFPGPPFWWPWLNSESVLPPNPYFFTPPTIASGNIQVHISETYVP